MIFLFIYLPLLCLWVFWLDLFHVRARIKANHHYWSWRTTALGLLAIGLGLVTGYWLYVPWAAWRNKLVAELVPMLFLIIGWALIHARDHRCRDREIICRGDNSQPPK